MNVTNDDSLWAGFLVTDPMDIQDVHERFSHNPELDMVLDACVRTVTCGRFDGGPAIMVETDVGVFIVDTDLSR